MSSLFRAKYINDSMFIEDLSRRSHYKVTLKISDNKFASYLCLITDIIACKDQRENLPIM